MRRTKVRLGPAVICAIAACSGAYGVPAGAQVAAPQRTFRSGIDLVTLDVSVVDREGRPVRDLRADDFVVTVNGGTRRVVSAQFLATEATAAGTAAPAPAHYSTNVTAGSGRLLALIVDQGNISAGGARAATEAAGRFLQRLPAGDRVGLHVIPGPGPNIPFSSNRALVASVLSKIAGVAPSSAFDRVAVGEAARIGRGDRAVLASVAARECAGADAQTCAQEIEGEARAVVADARERARASLAALKTLVEQLATSPSPKTVIFLSEALVIDQDYSDLAWLAPLAAKGQITVHVLRVDLRGAERGASRREGIDAAAAVEEGLSILAGSTGGSFFRAGGNVEGIFERIAAGMAGYYVLGFEPDASDRDGRSRRIRVEVPKARGGSIRARQEFRVSPTTRDADERILAETLRSPVLATDVGLNATAYVFPDADRGAVRIVLAAEITRAGGGEADVALGYALVDSGGRLVASGFEARLPDAPEPRSGKQGFAASARAAPGVYTLKLAVVDASGRRGSVEHTFRAEITSVGNIHTGDLLIGVPGNTANPTAPAVAGEFTDPESLNGYVELAAARPDDLHGVLVQMEVAPRHDAASVVSTRAVLTEAAGGAARRTGEAVIPLHALPAGDYVARAVISVDGQAAGQIARPFRIMRSSPAALSTRAGARSPVPAGLSLRIPPFAREQVLTPEIVGFALRRAGAAAAGEIPTDVMSHARAGRIAEALERARTAGHALATVFLQGLLLFAAGDLEAAAVRFREALRLDSEFFPAAFYLGSCYAAGGREREAAAAWQTSLATEESSAPFIHSLLADSLLRQREIDQALDILREGIARWPDDPALQVRLAEGLAMSARPAEALDALDRYLLGQPEDTDRLFLAMHLVYEAAVRGQPLASPRQDLARFDRYAAAYAAHGGPQQAMIDEWRRAVSARTR